MPKRGPHTPKISYLGAPSLTIGAFLPVLPTTPFLLLAAFLFSKGSPKLHARLLANPHFGPTIRTWQTRGAIHLRAKILSTIVMLALSAWMLTTPILPLVKIIIVLIQLSALTFIWTRPNS